MISIYRFTNLINGKVYIGSTINLRNRYLQHKKDAYKENMKHYAFYKAVNKYGWNLFSDMVVIDTCCPLIRNTVEDYWMAHYKSLDPNFGYNLISANHKIISQETRNKISAANKGVSKNKGRKQSKEEIEHRRRINTGKTRTPEQRNNLSNGIKRYTKDNPMPEDRKRRISETLYGRFRGEDSPRYGKVASEETRLKQRLAKLGKPSNRKDYTVSEETKEKLRQANLGKCVNEETKKKISQSNKGKPVSEETRKKLSLARRRTVERKRNLDNQAAINLQPSVEELHI